MGLPDFYRSLSIPGRPGAKCCVYAKTVPCAENSVFCQCIIIRSLPSASTQSPPSRPVHLNLAIRPVQGKRNLPVDLNQEEDIQLPANFLRAPPGRVLALRVVGDLLPATLSGALIRPGLVYPLASFDVSGQWPVSHADASPNEGIQFHCKDTPAPPAPSRMKNDFFVTNLAEQNTLRQDQPVKQDRHANCCQPRVASNNL